VSGPRAKGAPSSAATGPAEKTRRLPIGAEIVEGGTHFRVWAPARRSVDVVVDEQRAVPLRAEDGGYFAGTLEGVGPGARYRFRLDGGEDLYPDPASRFQPRGPHGPSQVVDPSRFAWSDGDWRGLELRGQVIYEMHVGTFTREGTWAAAAAELDRLRGICTTIEMMPVAEFAGEFGWGYDGVDLFAPTHLYGAPDDLRAFVDRAHGLGFAVLLDVVYNHLGPDGNYLAQFSESYFTDRHETEWGAAIRYDGEGSAGTREFFRANAGYWIDEFHFDGLRLDATQSIFDDSDAHILGEMREEVRAKGRGRTTVVVAENESQDARILRGRGAGGYGLDAAWNDDFHHSARVPITGRAEAYFSDHKGAPQEFISAAKHGYLFQGQYYAWQHKTRGTSTRGIPPERFITFLENHDQVANSARGERLVRLASPGRLRAMKALTMFMPATPMLFQGEEFAASTPFLYFADHGSELAALVRRGRSEFLVQFPSIAEPDVRSALDDPGARATFDRCKLDADGPGRGAQALALHRDLFALRRADPTVAAQGAHGYDGAVLSSHAFVLRLFGATTDEDRLILVNLGPDIDLLPAPEPLVGAPPGRRWSLVWSSEHPRYGGEGAVPPDRGRGLHLCAESTALLAPTRSEA
jgi:maltooligosyltrehalose trehalohydrolase